MNYIIIFCIYFLCINLNAQQFGFLTNSGETTSSEVIGYSIDKDSEGNLFVVGYYLGNATFGGVTLTSIAGYESFIAKYDNQGNQIWVNTGNSNANNAGQYGAVDLNDNVVAVGYFSTTTVNFSGLTLPSTSGSQDVYVVKYNSNGSILWLRKIGGAYTDEVTGVDTDSEGNIYVSGYYNTSCTFGNVELTNAGDTDPYLCKYDSDGNFQWVVSGIGTGSGEGNSVKVGQDDKIYLLGLFGSSIDFSGTPLNALNTEDLFLVEYDIDGNFISNFRDGNNSFLEANGLHIDNSGSIYICGSFFSSCNFSGISISGGGGSSSYVAKYNSSGSIIWAKSIGGSGGDNAYDVSTDIDENVYVVGFYFGTLTTSATPITTSGGWDIYTSKFNSDGISQWSISAGSTTRNDQGFSIVLDEYKTAYITGQFFENGIFGPFSVDVGTGNTNSFVASIFELTTPQINSNSILNIGPYSALIQGNLLTEGNSAVTSKGIVWSENPNPTTVLNTKTIENGGIGSFNSNLTGLSINTKYFFRTYIINSQGTFYGEELSFTTSPYIISEDGNQDGILDELQNNIVTILDGYNQSYITILSPVGTTINSALTDLNEDVNFAYPFGELEFKINASQAEVKIYYHGIESLDRYVYRKLFPNGTYKEFENVEFTSEIIGGNRVAVAILILTDGGPGDYDGIVNGVIYDPGGPALPITANIPIWDWWNVLVLVIGIIGLYFWWIK